jgi:hypothetical protein
MQTNLAPLLHPSSWSPQNLYAENPLLGISEEKKFNKILRKLTGYDLSHLQRPTF